MQTTRRGVSFREGINYATDRKETGYRYRACNGAEKLETRWKNKQSDCSLAELYFDRIATDQNEKYARQVLARWEFSTILNCGRQLKFYLVNLSRLLFEFWIDLLIKRHALTRHLDCKSLGYLFHPSLRFSWKRKRRRIISDNEITGGKRNTMKFCRR